MSKKKPVVALIYDFDGTLSPLNMQEYDFLKAIGIKNKADGNIDIDIKTIGVYGETHYYRTNRRWELCM